MKITTGKRIAPRRIMLYGQHGIGKSTWAASAPQAIFLNIEDGIADVDCAQTEHLKSYGDVVNALSWLLTEPHNFRTVVIDTVDWLEQLIHRDIASAAGVVSVADIDFGKGFPRAIPKWRYVLENLDALRSNRRMNVILLSHARVEKFSNPDGATYDRYAPDLWTNSRGEGVGNMIQEWCDEVLFAQFVVFTKKEGKGFNQKEVAIGGKDRVIKTCESASSLAKNRIGLPEEMPMDWKTYEGYVKAAYASRMKPVPPEEEKPSGNIAGIVNDGSSKQPAPVSEEATALVSDFAERF